MTLRAVRPAWGAWVGLVLTLIVPEMVWAQRSSDPPPPSATILSVTDLPDRAVSNKKKATSRRRRVVGSTAKRGRLTTAQRRRQQTVARQKVRQLALANKRALAMKNQQAALNRAKNTQAKANQVAQKARLKQAEVAQKTASPTLETSALKKSPTTSLPPTKSTAPAPVVGKTQVAQGGMPTTPTPKNVPPNPVVKTETKTSVAGTTLPNTNANKAEAGKPVAIVPAAKPVDVSPNDSLFKNTKPDLVQPRENPPVTDGGLVQLVLAFLVVVGVLLGGITLLKRYVQKGDTPLARQLAKQSAVPPKKASIWSSLFSKASVKRAEEQAGTNIRLVESLPTGNNTFIHLVEVHGKQFVVGATPWQFSMLTEIREGGESDPGFMDALRSASLELDKLGLIDTPDSKLGMSAVDAHIYDAKEAVVQNTERVRALRDQSRRS